MMNHTLQQLSPQLKPVGYTNLKTTPPRASVNMDDSNQAPAHTRIFNDILSLVTKPQCGISVYVSYRVLLTHCQEPFSGHPTELVCALMLWWLFPLDPQCSAVICCTACFIVLTNLHARIEPVTGWKTSLGMGKKTFKRPRNDRIPESSAWCNHCSPLFCCLSFVVSFFFFCWCCTLGKRDTVLLLTSSIKDSSVVKVKRRNRRRKDLITPWIYSVTSSWVWL